MITAAIMMLTNAAPRSPTYLDNDAFAGGWNATSAPARRVQTMATGRDIWRSVPRRMASSCPQRSKLATADAGHRARAPIAGLHRHRAARGRLPRGDGEPRRPRRVAGSGAVRLHRDRPRGGRV